MIRVVVWLCISLSAFGLSQSNEKKEALEVPKYGQKRGRANCKWHVSKLDYHGVDAKDISQEEEVALVRKMVEGDAEAREKLIRAHLRFVISHVKKYRGLGLSLDDLIAYGTLGLIEAIDRFSLEFETRVITYAAFWIRRSVMEALKQDVPIIRTPPYLLGSLDRLTKEYDSLRAGMDREPSLEEVMKELELNRRKAEYIMGQYRVRADSVETEFLNLLPITESKSRETSPHARLEDEENRQHIRNLISRLDKREQVIIERRYLSDSPESLEAIGISLGVTKERIRQLENQAIKKLRSWLGSID